jgi:hypothetical protein
MSNARPTQWPQLFDYAVAIIENAQAKTWPFDWSFGGGTALMLQIDHRESHDVDIFLDDPQILPFLNPQIQGYSLSQLPDTYDSDGARSIKLSYDGLGEIDFICS